MKHIRLFKTTSEFEANRGGGTLVEPWVVLTEDDMKVHIPIVEPPTYEIPNNEIWYTTTNGQRFEIVDAELMGLQNEYALLSNTYENGIGKMVFGQDVEYIGMQMGKTEEDWKMYPTFYTTDELVENTLETIMLPNSVKSIGVYAFYGCSNLPSIEIPNLVTSIGGGAFEDCSSLTSIEIPNSVTSIDAGAFEGCSSLTSITYDGTTEQWNTITKGSSWHDGVPSTTVISCSDGSVTLDGELVEPPTYEIPNNEIWYTTTDGQIFEMQDFESMGMQYEYTLESNTYENGIGKMVFDQDVEYLGVQMGDTEGDVKIYPIFGKLDLESGEPLENTLETIMLPNSVTSIDNGAFQYCSSLTSVTIGNSVTSIGISAFNGCTSLISIDIPNSVTSINTQAFNGCSSLTSVTIGNSVTGIGNQAFMYCTSLTNISYNGTVEQWNAITKGYSWHYNVPSTTVVTCTDGTVALN